jgi:hypothetical protein
MYKQQIQASRVVIVISLDQNMPRAPHLAPILGPQRKILGPQTDNRNFTRYTGDKRGPRSRSACSPLARPPSTRTSQGSSISRIGPAIWVRSSRCGLPTPKEHDAPGSAKHRKGSLCSRSEMHRLPARWIPQQLRNAGGITDNEHDIYDMGHFALPCTCCVLLH